MKLLLCYNFFDMSLVKVFQKYLNAAPAEIAVEYRKMQNAFVFNNVLRKEDNCLANTIFEFQEMELLRFLHQCYMLLYSVDDPNFEMYLYIDTKYFINWLEREDIDLNKFKRLLKNNFSSIINIIEETNSYDSTIKRHPLTAQIANMTFREKESLYLYAFFKFGFAVKGDDYE